MATGTDLSGAVALASALEHNQSVAALDMSNNQLVKTSFRSKDDRADDYSVTYALAKSLAVNQVSVLGCRACACACSCVHTAAVREQVLLRIDLSSNSVKKRGQVPIIEALRVCPCGLRFAPHVKQCVNVWFSRRMAIRQASTEGVSRYPHASLKWALARLSQFVFEALREERQIMF